MPASNPIALAFDTLVDQWVSFAEDDLADQLVRITTSERDYSSSRRTLEEQLTKALGPDWRDQLVQPKAV